VIQHSKFPDGSFVLHKVMLGTQKYSAWFHKDGTLKDAERICPDGRTRSIPTAFRHVRYDLGIIGRRYAGK
jgi:hypothetical protein